MIPEPGTAPKTGALACTKVLIADDEPNIVVSLEFMMKREGFDVLVARDGRQALDAIRREHPRLVLLDATMPGMSGFDVCEAVRADAEVRSTCIVMLTAKGRETDMARGVGAGADAYVTKPFSTRDLVQQVKDMLARDAAVGELAAKGTAASGLPKDLPA